jgi:Carbohydrate binding domain
MCNISYVHKWSRRLAFLLCSLLIILGLHWPTMIFANCPSSNSLDNAGFESGWLSGTALNWRDNSGWADLDVDYSRNTDVSRNGDIQRIDIGAVRGGAVQFVQAGIQLTEKRSYQISIWMRGNISAPVNLLLRKQGKPYTTYTSDGFKINETWKKYTYQAIAPINDKQVYFMVQTKGAGWIELDDAELVDITDCGVSTVESVGNQIANSSFEVGLDKWAVLTRENGNYEHMAQIRWESIPAKTTQATAVHGKTALELQVPRLGVVRLSSPFIILEPGQRFSLSLYAKSDLPRKIRFGVVGGDYGKQHGLIKNVKISEEWSRLDVSGTLPIARKNAYQFFVESTDEGVFWVDSIQLERKNKPTPYQPGQPIEVGFDRKGINLLLIQGVSESLPLRVYAPEESTVDIEVWSTDWQGNRKLMNRQHLSLDAKGYGLLIQPVDTKMTGYQKFTAIVGNFVGDSVSSELAVGVVPNMNENVTVKSPFGTHAWFSPLGLEQVNRLGARWLRLHPPHATKWAIVEPKKGDFRYFDASLLAARQRGFDILGSLDATPKWASGTDETKYFSYRSKPPKDISDWARYVKQTVSHYRGTINHWEVWNEPDSDTYLRLASGGTLKDKAKAYTQLLQVAYVEAKKANPDSVIVAGCPTGSNPVAWIDAIAKEGALQYMDVLSFHRYTDGRPGDAMDVTTGEIISKFRKIMQEHGDGVLKPIWETESGVQYVQSEYDYITNISGGYPSSAIEVAAYIVRNYAHLIEHDVERWFYYGATSSKRPDRTEFTGLFEWDSSPRPAAVAYAVMSNVISNVGYKESWGTKSGAHVARFSGNSEGVDIVWLDDWMTGRSINTKIKAPDDCSMVEVSDLMGNVIQPRNKASIVTVTASMVPLYIHWNSCGSQSIASSVSRIEMRGNNGIH